MEPRNSQLELPRLLLFALLGSINTAVCYVVYAALVAGGWHYNLALVLDYAFGAVLGFVLHRSATFADRQRRPGAFGRYVATLALGFLVNLIVLDAIVVVIHGTPVAAQLLAMTVATLACYPLQTSWVFGAQPAPALPAAPRAWTDAAPAAQRESRAEVPPSRRGWVRTGEQDAAWEEQPRRAA